MYIFINHVLSQIKLYVYIYQVLVKELNHQFSLLFFVSKNILALSQQPNKGNCMQCKTANELNTLLCGRKKKKGLWKVFGPTKQQIMNSVYPTNTHRMTCTHSLTWPPTQPNPTQQRFPALIKEHCEERKSISIH